MIVNIIDHFFILYSYIPSINNLTSFQTQASTSILEIQKTYTNQEQCYSTVYEQVHVMPNYAINCKHFFGQPIIWTFH